MQKEGVHEGEMVQIDNRLRFDDGKLYIMETTVKNGVHCGSKEVDVTSHVAAVINKYIEHKKSQV